MPPGCRCHLAMSHKAFLHDPDFVGIAPVPPARRIRGRKDFDLRSELLVGHKVGLITDAETPSDGLRRRDTSVETGINQFPMMICDRRGIEFSRKPAASTTIGVFNGSFLPGS